MEIVGRAGDHSGDHVETIDVWYSSRRRAWFVERLDENGDQIGVSYRCFDEADTVACLAEWLRAHEFARIASPSKLSSRERRLLAQSARRAA